MVEFYKTGEEGCIVSPQVESSPSERVLLASSDCHVGPRLKQLREYCEQAYLDEFDAFARDCPELPQSVSHGDDGLERFGKDLLGHSQILSAGHYDVHERLRQLDADGVAAEVIFHGSQNGSPIPFMSYGASLSLSPGDDDERTRELSYAGMRIYNRWLADFCTVEPDRHVGLAHLPIWDLDLAIQELEWARKAGLRGVNFPAPRPSLPDFNDPVWDRFWAACAANDMPLNTHGGSETLTKGIARYQGQGGYRVYVPELTRFSFRGMAWLICGGVFDRHPNLKLLLTEVPGVSVWLPATLLELDEVHHLKTDPAGPSKLLRRPSEYFPTNCFIGASFMSHADAQGAVDQDLVDNYMWGSDYPHREGTYPWSKESLRMTMEGIAPDVIRRLVGLNLVELFNLDRNELEKVAERIGPNMQELTTPLTPAEIPDDPSWLESTYALRKGVFWA